MNKITNIQELEIAIKQLEEKNRIEVQSLKLQLNNTYESFRPANLIKNTLIDLSKTPNLKKDFINTTLSFAAGYVSKKIIVGTSHNLVMKITGVILQMGVTDIFLKNADKIKSGILNAVNYFSHKK